MQDETTYDPEAYYPGKSVEEAAPANFRAFQEDKDVRAAANLEFFDTELPRVLDELKTKYSEHEIKEAVREPVKQWLQQQGETVLAQRPWYSNFEAIALVKFIKMLRSAIADYGAKDVDILIVRMSDNLEDLNKRRPKTN